MRDWKIRHLAAWRRHPVANMLDAWARVGELHRAKLETTIGADGVLGPQWQAIGLGIRGLLNGDLGDLDAGECDRFILATLAKEGMEIP